MAMVRVLRVMRMRMFERKGKIVGCDLIVGGEVK